MSHEIRIPAGNEVAARLAALTGSGKLASLGLCGHKLRMRHLVLLPILFAAACAPTPAPQPTQAAPAQPAAAAMVNRHDHSTLNGMTANELAEHFGRPRLQVREGDGTKLQFTGPSCVLDAYLYAAPSGQGIPRVTHVDARNFQGANVNTQACIASIEGR